VGDAAVWAARRGAVLGRLLRAIALEAEEGGALAPALVEHRFGGRAPQPALVFGEGERMVKLRGRLDRVDAGPDRLLVIDYKNSRDVAGHRQKLQGDDLGVTNFQIPAYLLAAAQALPGRRQLAASYRLLRAPTSLAPLELEADCDLLALEPGRRAAVRASGGRTFADAVVELVDRVRAGELAPRSRGCQGCGFGAICRVEFEAEGEP
jgi:ATP-dependent helicase/DNAse subunit B